MEGLQAISRVVAPKSAGVGGSGNTITSFVQLRASSCGVKRAIGSAGPRSVLARRCTPVPMHDGESLGELLSGILETPCSSRGPGSESSCRRHQERSGTGMYLSRSAVRELGSQNLRCAIRMFDMGHPTMSLLSSTHRSFRFRKFSSDGLISI